MGGPGISARDIDRRLEMNIFNSIKEAIFGKAKPKVGIPVSPSAVAPQAAPVTPAAIIDESIDMMDVEAILTTLATAAGEPLNWRTSIVDLMKLLDLDSSLTARKSLADELGYSGDKNDSATMNIWLHKQVMSKLAEHGGKVPADLKD
jgi:hypothetical protein